jgi:signal recognition particle subunit SRP68
MFIVCISRYLLLPLFEAERAWSYAMQLKEEANTEPRKRFHLMSRLRKAVNHTEILLSLCEGEKCDARTNLEAQAYCAFFKGALYFEQNAWKKAIDQYTSAKLV